MPLPNTPTFTPLDPLPASKLTDLVENDQALSDGSAIDDLSLAVTDLSNPYKFSAYKTTTQSSVPTNTKITFDTEDYDNNNNFASSRYTAPVAGFYQFYAQMYISSSTTSAFLRFYKNGAAYRYGNGQSSTSSSDVIINGLMTVSLAQGDTIEVYIQIGGGASRDIQGTTGVSIRATVFEGRLVSQA